MILKNMNISNARLIYFEYFNDFKNVENPTGSISNAKLFDVSDLNVVCRFERRDGFVLRMFEI